MKRKRKVRPPIPPGSPIPLEVFSVEFGEPQTILFLSDPIGILTHRPGDDSFACPGEEDCQKTLHRGKTYWKGYCAAHVWRDQGEYRDWIPTVYEVTEAFAETVAGRKLTGAVWKVYRGGRYGSNEVCGELVDQLANVAVPESFDVKPVVEKIYRTRNILYGVQPPNRERLLMRPSTGYIPPTASPMKSVEKPLTKEEMDKFRDRAKMVFGYQNPEQHTNGKVVE